MADSANSTTTFRRPLVASRNGAVVHFALAAPTKALRMLADTAESLSLLAFLGAVAEFAFAVQV
ncbi:MAG: hypothetical protein JWM36_678 [Hyphomicrobiales bacterium]|nr:hypothetical protein [Hyphomicrobiales bacterium]